MWLYVAGIYYNNLYEKVSDSENALRLIADDSENIPTTDYKLLLENVLKEMPPKCREVFKMSKLQKMKYKEIAERLNISEKTVENHIGKAILSFSAIGSFAKYFPKISSISINSFISSVLSI